MKFYYLLLFIITFSFLQSSNTWTQEGPKVYFPKDVYHIVLIKEDIHKFHVWFKNIGDEPLTISGVEGNGVWLSASSENNLTQAGEWNFISVICTNIDGNLKEYHRTGSVQLHSNAVNNSEPAFKIELSTYPKRIEKHGFDSVKTQTIDTVFAPLTVLYKGEWDKFYVDIRNPFPSRKLIVDNLIPLDSEAESPIQITMNPERSIIPVYGSVSCRFALPSTSTFENGIYTNRWKLTFRNLDYQVIIVTNVMLKEGRTSLIINPIKVDTVPRGTAISIGVTIRNVGNSGIELILPDYYQNGMEAVQMRGLSTVTKFPTYIPANDSIYIPFEISTVGINGNYNRTLRLISNESIKNQKLILSFNGFSSCETCPEITFDSLEITRNIEHHGNGNFEFWFTNTGLEPLIISSAKTNDGGSVATCNRTPIPPGGRDKISVKYDTHRLGPFRRSITIHSNAYPNSRTSLRIKGTVFQ